MCSRTAPILSIDKVPLYGCTCEEAQGRVLGCIGKYYRFTPDVKIGIAQIPRFQVFAEGTSNPYGIAWAHDGSAIVEACHWATDHLFHFVETAES